MQQALNEPIKHGLAAGETGRPARVDWTIDQDWAHYSAQEHAIWKTLFERQTRLLPGRAWRFPAGQFIRQPHQLDYLEEPDVFHDVFGHVPMLMNPAIADYIQAYGVGGLRAQKLGVLDKLARVYWYTVEFGLVQQKDGLRIYGSGIASSASESVFALDDPSPNRLRFDLERVMRTRYRIDDFQETYFVIDDLDELLELARIDFGSLYERVQGQPEYEPGTVLPTDRVLTRGTGRYHKAKRPGASA